MKILLSQNKHAQIDPQDWPLVSKYKWHYATGYARRHNGYKKTPVPLHRELLRAKKGEIIDHINGDKLDNRRSNLRICTISENAQNSRLPINNLSGYKGVTWHKVKMKWLAQIMKDGKQHFLGYFLNAEDGARAYNEAAMRLHGEFASINMNLCQK